MYSLKKSSVKMDFVILLSLFTVFLAAAAAVVIFGAKQYSRNTERMLKNSSERNIAAYMTEKIRRGQDLSGVRLEEVQGTEVLVLDSGTDQAEYQTYIYALDGWLYELAVSRQAIFSLKAGQKLMEVGEWKMDLSDQGLLTIEYADAEAQTHTIEIRVLTDWAAGKGE